MMDVVAAPAPPRTLQDVIAELNRRRGLALTQANRAVADAERARHAGVAEGILLALNLLAGLPRQSSRPG